MGLDPTYPSVPMFSFIGFILVLVPLPWQFNSWSVNVGAISYSIWVALLCLDSFIRTIVWKDNVNNVAPVYCDISTHLEVALDIAIPMCSLCINRRLYRIIRNKATELTSKEKRNVILFDLFLCVGIPLLNIPLYYIVQPLRFEIAEQSGCAFVNYPTALSIIIMFVLPVIPSLISVCYTPFIVRTFLKSRKEIDQVYNGSARTSATKSHCFRLMALSSLDAFITLPTGIVSLGLEIEDAKRQAGFFPYPGWKEEHADINQVVGIPASVWRSDSFVVGLTYYAYWQNFMWALVFFLFFGTTPEMKRRYMRVIWFCLKPFGLKPKESVTDATISDMKFGTAPNIQDKQHRPDESLFMSNVIESQTGGDFVIETNAVSIELTRHSTDGSKSAIDDDMKERMSTTEANFNTLSVVEVQPFKLDSERKNA